MRQPEDAKRSPSRVTMINSGLASATSMPDSQSLAMKARENRASSTRVTCAGALRRARTSGRSASQPGGVSGAAMSLSATGKMSPAPCSRRSASSAARAERRPSTTIAPTEAPAADSTARSQPVSISMRSRNAPRTPSRSPMMARPPAPESSSRARANASACASVRAAQSVAARSSSSHEERSTSASSAACWASNRSCRALSKLSRASSRACRTISCSEVLCVSRACESPRRVVARRSLSRSEFNERSKSAMRCRAATKAASSISLEPDPHVSSKVFWAASSSSWATATASRRTFNARFSSSTLWRSVVSLAASASRVAITFSSAEAISAWRSERSRSCMTDAVPRARSASPWRVPSAEASISSRRLAISAAALEACASRVTSSRRSPRSLALEPTSSPSMIVRRRSKPWRRVEKSARLADRRSASTSE